VTARVDRVLFGGALVALALAALNQSMVAVALP
jgi:acyl-CoA thioesterase